MKLFKKRIKKTGLPPGTLIVSDNKKIQKSHISIFHYNENSLQETTHDTLDYEKLINSLPVYWVNVDGLYDVKILETIGKAFSIHFLSLEDILNTDQRPKCEEHEDYIFLVVKMITHNKEKDEIDSEQVSFLVTENAALTFQEKTGDVFNPVRERIRKGKGRIRKKDSDYLVYSLFDIIVDEYFEVLEHLGEKVENLENEVIDTPSTETAAKIHSLRQKVLLLRRSIWPLREVINSIMRSESTLIHDDTKLFLRDLYDHTIQVIETIETYRDMLVGILDMYISVSGNRMNEIMKVLTIISTLFMPLGFLAGVYGMNFKYMPELESQWGYPVLIGFMILIIICLLAYFKKRKWI